MNSLDRLVSIIIPVYNMRNYLSACLESVINQDYSNIEIIIVNDGSTDNSLKICEEYKEKDNRIILIDKENGGLSSARNEGLKRMSGEYVCFVDSDDYLDLNFVSTLVNAISYSDIVISKHRNIYNGKISIPFKNNHINKEYSSLEKETNIIKHLLFESGSIGDVKFQIMPVWKNLYKASLINENNISFKSERKYYVEDFIFNLEAYTCAKSIIVCDFIGYNHLINYGSLSQKYRPTYYEMEKNLISWTLNFLKKNHDELIQKHFEQQLPCLLAYALFKMSRCERKDALINVSNILKDDFCIKILEKYDGKNIKGKEKRIFIYAKKGKSKKIVSYVKFLEFLEPIYRKFKK